MATNEIHSPEQHHTLPGEGTYFTIFLALAALTVTELLVTYLEIVKIPLLLGLAITKAWLVVQYYMHLRYDSRVFSWVLIIPTIMGLIATIFLQILVRVGH